MINEPIDEALGRYSDAYDFYMDAGSLPPDMDDNDRLGGYLKTFIDNNPLSKSDDSSWVDIYKEGLMGYYGQLLNAASQIDQAAKHELGIIDEFENASIERKRQMWGPITQSIRAKYSRYEVDVDGFSKQFGTADRDAVFQALISDWRNACLERAREQQQSLFTESKHRFEISMANAGAVDYEERRAFEEISQSVPAIREITDAIGREYDNQDGDEDNIIYKFLPQGARTGLPSDDVDTIENGDNIHRVLPAEFAMPDDLFYKRLASKELQQIAPPRFRKPKKTEEIVPKPRPKKGPIIVAVDTSGSMHGYPEKVAKAALIQLVKIARKDNRSCYLITFSVRIKTVDLGKSANIIKMREFLKTHFTGGTNESAMIVEALKILDTNEYEMADVLIISDFIFDTPRYAELSRISQAKKKGTRFYGLQINSTSKVFDLVLDKKWKI